MATVAKDRKTGNRTLWFVLDGRRVPIWLGKMPQRDIVTWKHHVEELVAARMQNRSPMPETSQWVADLDLSLHRKLVGKKRPDGSYVVGLVEPRERAEKPNAVTLGALLAAYVAKRSDVKKSTATVYGHTTRCLVEYFGADKPLASITPGDADDWRRWLSLAKNEKHPERGGQGLAENTARRRCSIAKQFFRWAQRHRLIETNPFGDMKGIGAVANRERDHFITREVSEKVIAACPDAQWKLLFALSRYAGLRCPSEHLTLTWSDIDWERGRIAVRSPKTEHHVGKGVRTIPLFDELRPHLEAVRDEANPGIDVPFSAPVITRYRDVEANLRTGLDRIIAKAGFTPWPKRFQNLRSSCETELAKKFPSHVVCKWLGHSRLVAQRHYLQVTDDDFDQATGKTMRQTKRAVAISSDQKKMRCTQTPRIAMISGECANR